MGARGRAAREYLPSEEREAYVAYARRRGRTLVTVQQKNCYVDEFVRFCSSQSGHSNVNDIDTTDFLNYGKWLGTSCRTFATRLAKIGGAIQWFSWLAETGRIKTNPARGLIASRLIPSSGNANAAEQSAAFRHKPETTRA